MSGRARHGFTLLELLIGVVLAVTLLGAMAWFVTDLVATRDRVAAAANRDGAATAMFERIETDLAFAVTSDAAQSGVRGDSTTLSILTRGVQLSESAQRLGDLQRQEYRFESARHAIIGVRGASVAGETPAVESHPLLETHVERLRFRYHDGSSWRTDFDSRRDGGLPTLVEVALWWAPRTRGDDAESGESLDDALTETEESPEARRTAAFADFDDEFVDPDDLAGERADETDARAPDRLRVIRVPDARPIDADAVIVESDETAESRPGTADSGVSPFGGGS